MRQTTLPLLLLAALIDTGCATITRGSSDTLVIESDPPGADVKLSNGLAGKTPVSFKLSRKDAVVVELQKTGYEPVKVNVQPQISGAGGVGMAGNVLLGGIVGAAVDVGTGAMNDLKPNPIQVRLVRHAGEGAEDAGETAGAVEQRLETLKAMRRSGLLTEAEYRRKRSEILSRL